MASNNNPTTPAAPTQPAAAPAPVAAAPVPNVPTIQINGQTLDLRLLAATTPEEIERANQNGDALYKVLPAEYQVQADKVAQFALAYRAIITETGAAGGKETLSRYWQWVKDGAENGKDGANVAMRAIHEKVHNAMPSSLQAAGAFTSFMSGLTNGAFSGTGRVFGALGDLTSGVGMPDFSGITEAQAHTFGAAYAGILYDQRQRDASLPMIDWPWSATGSKIFNNLGPYATAGLRWIGAAIHCLWNKVTGKEDFPIPSFSALLEEETFRHSNKDVTEKLNSIGPIAGIEKTPEMARALTGAIVTTNNGNLASVTADPKGLVIENQKDANGKDITLFQQNVNNAKETLLAGTQNESAPYRVGDAIGVSAGAVAGTGLAIFKAPTILRGVHNGFNERYENAPLKRAIAHEASAHTHYSGMDKKWYDPRGWFKSEARGDFHADNAKDELNQARARSSADGQGFKAHAEAVTKEMMAEKPGFFGKAKSFFSHPIQSTSEGIGSLFGRSADATARATSGTIADGKSIFTGLSETLPGLGKFGTRALALTRFGGRALGVTGTVITAATDVADGYHGVTHGDGHEVASSVGRLGGGVTGAMYGVAGGVAAGAAVGAWFGLVGAVPGAILGGIGAAIGGSAFGWLGATAGGVATDYVAGNALNQTIFRGTPHGADGKPIEGKVLSQEWTNAHQDVIDKARQAVNRGTSEKKLVAFNLGTAVTTYSPDAVHPNGLPNPTGGAAPAKQTGQVHAGA